MKLFYLISFLSLFFGLNTFAQSDLIGTWYLDHIIKDGVTHPNYYNDHQIFDLELTSNPLGPLDDSFQFTIGHGCEASSGFYTSNITEIAFDGAGTISEGCSTEAHSRYNTLFFDEFIYNNIAESIHTYSLNGEVNDEVLTLTNPNGNSLIYKKQSPSGLLVSTWWLYQIDIPGNPILNIPDTGGLYMTLTNNVSPNPLLPEIDGFGGCNSFYAKYSVSFNAANNISIPDFVATLIGCSLDNYEGYFFSILSNITTNFFEFEIINDGSTLILTDLLGARLIFGDVSLSIDEENANNLSISLLQNPVINNLKLDIEQALLNNKTNYTIYSIEGKSIMSDLLTENFIDVNLLYSGIYFIRFESNEAIKTIKFIKK